MTTCYGGLDSLGRCESPGMIPFTLLSGCEVLLCELHYWQHKASDRRCEAQFLVGIDEDGKEIRERCESAWVELYITSENDLKRLCGFHNAFMDMCERADEQIAQLDDNDVSWEEGWEAVHVALARQAESEAS